MEPQVETGYGFLRGSAENGVHVFRGIPFAQPPVGDLRFRPPQPLEPWSGVRDATAFGPCPHQADMSGSLLERLLTLEYPRQDEDCLTLNIWTPAADGRRRPVLVWIHGGAFVSGTGSLAMYDGTSLADNGDVVVVTINYRLGAFGFLRLDSLCGPEFDATGNQGLLDQVAALEWVKSEIGHFGGDPSNITVFGQSAGAASIATMMAMPNTTGLFEKAIIQSGAPNLLRTPEAAEQTARHILDELGIEPGDAGRLREVPAEDLAAAQDRATPRSKGVFYGPVVDDELVPVDPYHAIAEGHASSVSLLVGTNEDEMRFFLAADPAVPNLDEEGLLDRVTKLIGEGEDAAERAKAAITTYRAARAEREEDTSPAGLLCAIATDCVFRWPALHFAALQARHVPVYTYVFDWQSPALDGSLGAPHLLEVPFVFGTHQHPGIRGFTGEGVEADELSHAMQEAWVRFARFGSPSTPALPEWPPYGPGQHWTMRLGRGSGAEANPREHERSFWDHPATV